MTTPFLIADAAEVAIMSPLAEAAFGSYDLRVPDGIDIEDVHEFEAPGNELGYVARLSPQRATGIARRFIRADVSVTAKDDTDPDVIPESDVDRVLSEAESRVESEFFLESDITKAGLGAWVPYADFNVGDIVNVRIFDIWVKLPVTRIEPIISEGDVVDWRVHVGGQLLSDDQAREVENATIQKELIQDRRDLAGIDAKATQAKDTADQAKQATEDNRTYIDEQLVAAGAAVEQGREYLRQMEEHVAAGNAAVGQVGELAGQAAAAADDAVQILNQLDPLRDNVAAIHGDVVDLGREAQELVGAADEAVRQAIEKLAQADGKLQEADQKLQQQIDVLEDSQELLAKAVQILDGAVDQAAAAAQYAIQSADNAGKAAGEALSASEHNSSAIDAMEDTIEAREQTVEAFKQTQNEIDDMQNDAIAALESQAAEIAELQNRALNMAMVDREGTTHPDITIFKLVNTTAYDVEINNITPGTKIHADFYNRASGDSVTFVRTKQYVSTGTTKVLSADSSNQVVNLMWARPSVYQVPINLSSGAMSLDKGEWKDVPGLSRTAAGKVTNGQLKIRGTWSAANRGSTYGIRVLIGTSVFKSFTTRNLGPLSFFGDGESTYTVSVTNLKMNANQTLKVQMYSYASNAYQRSVKSATAVGSWIETA